MSPANLLTCSFSERYACKLAFPLTYVCTAWNGLCCSTAITYYRYIISAASNALLLIGVKTDCQVKKEVQ